MSTELSIDAKDVLSALITGLHDGLAVSDLTGRLTLINDAFCQLVGYPKEELLNQPLNSIIVADKCQTDDGKTGPTINGANYASIYCRNGAILVMPVSQTVLEDSKNSIIGCLTIVYIVQTASVQQAQTEFVSTVSHELRTPLTSIKGFADTILRAGDRLDSAQQRRYVSIIKDQSDRLTRLVEDLLAVSRLESKKMQLTIRAIDLLEAVQRVIRNLVDKIGSHRIITSIPSGLAPVWADGDRLEQILTNLIDNAIKYSPPSTTVTVSAREDHATMPKVEFSVADEGVGIAPEHISEIFSKFSRLDNPLVRQTEGSGLGLYITRSLVIALGGEISVKSAPGTTVFTVRLPAATLEQQAARGRDLP